MRLPPWPRPCHQPTTRVGREFRIIWLETAIEKPRFSLSRHGFPGTTLDDVDMTLIDDAAWLRSWIEGPWGYQLEQVRGLDVERMRACTHGMVIKREYPDPIDLTPIQINVAVCKALADQGAVAVLDVIGDRWWSPAALRELAPDRPFDIEEHITVTGETTERERGAGHLCHTRGLRKFARPEIFIRGLQPGDFNGVTHLLNDLGDRLVQGMEYGEDSVVVIHLPDESTLPPIAFVEHGDDTESSRPSHGLGPQMFNSSTLEVLDYDEGTQGPAKRRPDKLLEAIRRIS